MGRVSSEFCYMNILGEVVYLALFVKRKYKKLFCLQDEQTLEKQDLLRKKAIYSLALAEMEKPLLKLEEEAEKIKTCHQEHADVSIYH